jgi:hypothetical protein
LRSGTFAFLINKNLEFLAPPLRYIKDVFAVSASKEKMIKKQP